MGRRRVVSVPQFHENHIFTGTLAFNLLMGRCWPPRPDDLVEAEAVCRELGLGELIERMPAGMGQMVGESGWQLSHGERSRVYLARALLQSAEMVICDESFGALDPHNLSLALRCALRRAPTLLVIAHPEKQFSPDKRGEGPTNLGTQRQGVHKMKMTQRIQTAEKDNAQKADKPVLKVRTQIKAGYYLGIILRGGKGPG